MQRQVKVERAFFATTTATKWRARVIATHEEPEGWLKNGGVVPNKDDAQVFDTETEATEKAKEAGFVIAG